MNPSNKKHLLSVHQHSLIVWMLQYRGRTSTVTSWRWTVSRLKDLRPHGLIDSTRWSRWSVNLTHGTNRDRFDMLGSWVGKLWKLHHRKSVELVCVPVFLHLGSLVRTWFCSYLWSVIRHLCMLASLFYVYPELRTYFHIPTTSILTLWWICWLPPINLFAGWLPRCGQ